MAFYNRLKEKGKNGKVIVCAIMRKLVHIIFGILKSGKKFDPNYKPVFAWQERYLQVNNSIEQVWLKIESKYNKEFTGGPPFGQFGETRRWAIIVSPFGQQA